MINDELSLMDQLSIQDPSKTIGGTQGFFKNPKSPGDMRNQTQQNFFRTQPKGISLNKDLKIQSQRNSMVVDNDISPKKLSPS